jgi:uncharacterized repeat protein (TIGR01451 family)
MGKRLTGITRMIALMRRCGLMSSRPFWVCCLGALLCSFILSPRDSYAQFPARALCLPGTILFVHSAQQPAEGDLPLIVYLMAQGHTVIDRSDTEVRAADLAGADLVILAAASAPAALTTQLRDTAVPLLTWAAPLYDDLRLTGPIPGQDFGVLSRQRKVDIVNPDHPLAGGLVRKPKATSSKDTDFAWGVPQQTAVVVATTHQGHPRPLLFAYEAGDEMVGGIAPARRVAFPVANGLALTDEGWTLFNAAVQWSMACTAEVTPTKTPVPPAPQPTYTQTQTSGPTNTSTAVATNSPTTTPIPSSATPSPTPTLTVGETPSTPTTATPTTPTPVTGSQLTVGKRDFFFTDADENNQVSPGDTILYIIQGVNVGRETTPHLRVTDALDPNTQLVAGSVKVIGGVVVQGNGADDRGVTVKIPPLNPGASAAISLQVQVMNPGSDQYLHNQALVHFLTADGQPSGQPPRLSDDPDTALPDDATTTPLMDAVAQPGSSLFLPLIHNPRPE